MKNILLIINLLVYVSLFSYAGNIDECKTDIYFGNGVWNKQYSNDNCKKDSAAECSVRYLDRLIEKEIIKKNPILQTKYGNVKLAYNWGQGTMQDVLETYNQLKEAGQLEGIGYFAAMAALTGKYELALDALVFAELWEPFTKGWEQGNVDEMWQKYYHESFKLGHRVLLVSHSQGNLFANRIYDTINPPEYRKYFANVQVASPASEVKVDEVGKGSYVTLWGDPVINPIPGSMPGNANGSPGHAFVAAYLAQQDPYDKIVSRIKAVLPTLDVELTQWDTEGEPSNKGTCEEKVKVKHRFDLAVDMPFDVYPFNLSKKLYQVNGEWVKASCGGKNILDQGDGKKDNECWMIDNPAEEKIGGKGDRFIRIGKEKMYQESPRYARIGGVIFDKNTSLMWQDDLAMDTVHKPWVIQENFDKKDYFNTSGDTVVTYCENLILEGYDDWRVPAKDELVSISRKTSFNDNLFDIFVPLGPGSFYRYSNWSSTLNPNDNRRIGSVDYRHGGFSDRVWKAYYGSRLTIRCVREEI